MNKNRFEPLFAAIDSRGELPFVTRMEILRSLSARARKELAFQVAMRVSSIWYERFPDEATPFELLQNLYDPAAGVEDDRETSTQLARLQNYLDEKFDCGSSFYPAIYAGYSAWCACHVLLHDESLGRTASEEDTDPDDWGPAFYAACAYAGGAHWDVIPGDDERRRDFWNWYLSTLVELPED